MGKYLFLIAACSCSLFTLAQNVGVGVANPQNKLHVGGGFRLDTLTGVGGSGLLWHNPNGVVYGLKYSGNTSDVLRGDGTFGPYNPAINGALGWLLVGNSGTNPSNNFIGTIDDQPLAFRVNNVRHGFLSKNNIFLGSNAGIANTGINNIAIGSGALAKNTSRARLIAIGDSALYNNLGTIPDAASATNNIAIGYKALYASVNGGSNIAIGSNALEKNLSYGNVGIGFLALGENVNGLHNVAIGYLPLMRNTSGSSNCAIGSAALSSNTIGYENTAIGSSSLSNNNGYFNSGLGANSLSSNTSGHDNTALGYSALKKNTTASFNTSIGAFSLFENETGHSNTAVGYFSMLKNTVGSFNTAMGTGALHGNEYGKNNTAYGYNSLLSNAGIFAEWNTAIGSHALANSVYGYENTAIGGYALHNNVSGRRNTALGYAAGYNLPNNVENVTVIGFNAGFLGTQTNHVNIGNDLVTWNGGRLPWSTWSDKRMKDDVQENVPGLAFITRLKPVTYRINISKQRAVTKVKDLDEKDWEGKYDIEKIKMTGFLAQDVEAAAAEINYDFSGVHKPKSSEGLYSLQYAAFVVPLVKAVQEQQKIIEDQNKKIDKQQQQIDLLIKEMQSLKKDLISQKN